MTIEALKLFIIFTQLSVQSPFTQFEDFYPTPMRMEIGQFQQMIAQRLHVPVNEIDWSTVHIQTTGETIFECETEERLSDD